MKLIERKENSPIWLVELDDGTIARLDVQKRHLIDPPFSDVSNQDIEDLVE
jgi:hypothetical protein